MSNTHEGGVGGCGVAEAYVQPLVVSENGTAPVEADPAHKAGAELVDAHGVVAAEPETTAEAGPDVLVGGTTAGESEAEKSPSEVWEEAKPLPVTGPTIFSGLAQLAKEGAKTTDTIHPTPLKEAAGEPDPAAEAEATAGELVAETAPEETEAEAEAASDEHEAETETPDAESESPSERPEEAEPEAEVKEVSAAEEAPEHENDETREELSRDPDVKGFDPLLVGGVGEEGVDHETDGEDEEESEDEEERGEEAEVEEVAPEDGATPEKRRGGKMKWVLAGLGAVAIGTAVIAEWSPIARAFSMASTWLGDHLGFVHATKAAPVVEAGQQANPATSGVDPTPFVNPAAHAVNGGTYTGAIDPLTHLAYGTPQDALALHNLAIGHIVDPTSAAFQQDASNLSVAHGFNADGTNVPQNYVWKW